MKIYKRSTRACYFPELKPEIIQAVRDYVNRYDLGDIERQILICCETVSEKLKKGGLFGSSIGDPDPDKVHHVGMLVTPEWLVWARHGEKSGTRLSAARLKEIEIRDLLGRFKDFKVKLEDDGISVFGFINRSSERVTAMIGLGPEQAAQDFRTVLQEAWEKAQ